MKKTMKKVIIVTIALMLVLLPQFALATADTTKIDTLIKDLIVPWVSKIGLVIGFIGGIMFALGWRNDDADSKARGLQTLISGFMVSAIALGYDKFM